MGTHEGTGRAHAHAPRESTWLACIGVSGWLFSAGDCGFAIPHHVLVFFCTYYLPYSSLLLVSYIRVFIPSLLGSNARFCIYAQTRTWDPCARRGFSCWCNWIAAVLSWREAEWDLSQPYVLILLVGTVYSYSFILQAPTQKGRLHLPPTEYYLRSSGNSGSYMTTPLQNLMMSSLWRNHIEAYECIVITGSRWYSLYNNL